MLTIKTSEILGSLAFAVLVAVTTHVVYLLRTHRNRERRFRGRYASACIGVGTFVGMIIAVNVNPGFATLPVFGGMFGGWYVARRMGFIDTSHDPEPSGTACVDPNNPYSPPGALTPVNTDGGGEPSDAAESPDGEKRK